MNQGRDQGRELGNQEWEGIFPKPSRMFYFSIPPKKFASFIVHCQISCECIQKHGPPHKIVSAIWPTVKKGQARLIQTLHKPCDYMGKLKCNLQKSYTCTLWESNSHTVFVAKLVTYLSSELKVVSSILTEKAYNFTANFSSIYPFNLTLM